MAAPGSLDVFVVAPTGADAANIRAVLLETGIEARICAKLENAAAEVSAGEGVLIVTEDALVPQESAVLATALGQQPAWSDVPIVLIASSSSMHHWATETAAALGERSHVTMVARPLRAATLVAAVNAARQVRRRQYQLRDLIAEREAVLVSLEERVQERTARLQELVAELESFSYSVSHDLRAPLRVMAGYAQAILEDFRPTLVPEVVNYVERIARSAERMDRLTQDVLAYTRLSRSDVKLEPIDLALTLQEIIDQYPTLSAAQTAIRIRAPLAPVMGHSASLAQGLSNLIENALKFTRPHVAPIIEVRTECRNGRVRIYIKDNGIGIAPEHQRKIFSIFERVAGREVPGTGIGLAIVKKAAERMAGSVGVTSEIGDGAEFWIELPAPPPC